MTHDKAEYGEECVQCGAQLEEGDDIVVIDAGGYDEVYCETACARA